LAKISLADFASEVRWLYMLFIHSKINEKIIIRVIYQIRITRYILILWLKKIDTGI